jgi:hypothetical protein
VALLHHSISWYHLQLFVLQTLATADLHVLEYVTTMELGQTSALSGLKVSNVKPKYCSKDRDGSPLKPSGHYMYHQFNIQQFYVLPTQCIYVFYVDLKTNSDYFSIQR